MAEASSIATSLFGPYTPLILQLGAGGLIGFMVGYAIKKLIKLLLVIGGLLTLLALYLSHEGYISINWEKIGVKVEEWLSKITGAGEGGTATLLVKTIVENLPFAGSFLVGLAAGLKAG